MDRQHDTISSLLSRHGTASVENDFQIHLGKSEHFFRRSIDHERIDTDEEEVFTDLRACEEPIDTDSESYRSSSPADLESNQPEQSCSSSCSKPSLVNTPETASSRSMSSFCLKSSDDLLHLIRQDPYKFIFVAHPKEMKNFLQCRIVRSKSTVNEMLYLEIEFDSNEDPITLLTAEKRRRTLGQSQYLISINPTFDCDLCPVELTATNLTGTEYILQALNGDPPQDLAIIQYESNFLGLKGPRKTNVLLPKLDQQMQPFFEEHEIEEFCSKDHDDSFVRLYNKTPTWSTESGTYMIRFDGTNRVVVPSVKNFQMIAEKEDHEQHVVMEFGRKSGNAFSCDFRYPLSFVQAFSIGLTAFETRLFRE